MGMVIIDISVRFRLLPFSSLAFWAMSLPVAAYSQVAIGEQKPTELKVTRSRSTQSGDIQTTVSTPYLSLTNRKRPGEEPVQVFTVTISDNVDERLQQILFVAGDGVSLETMRLDKKSQVTTETKYDASGDILCQRLHKPGEKPPPWLDRQGREIPPAELRKILSQTGHDLRENH